MVGCGEMTVLPFDIFSSGGQSVYVRYVESCVTHFGGHLRYLQVIFVGFVEWNPS